MLLGIRQALCVPRVVGALGVEQDRVVDAAKAIAALLGVAVGTGASR